MKHLSSELNKHALLREKLIVEFPSADEETLADTLDGLTELSEVIAALLRSSQEDRAMADGLGEYIGELVARAGRINDRAAKKRTLCLDAMERANIKKIAAPDFTASLRSNRPKVVVVDESKIPTMFWDPQPDKLNKRKLAEALLTQGVEGAMFSNPAKTISIRTK